MNSQDEYQYKPKNTQAGLPPTFYKANGARMPVFLKLLPSGLPNCQKYQNQGHSLNRLCATAQACRNTGNPLVHHPQHHPLPSAIESTHTSPKPSFFIPNCWKDIAPENKQYPF